MARSSTMLSDLRTHVRRLADVLHPRSSNCDPTRLVVAAPKLGEQADDFEQAAKAHQAADLTDLFDFAASLSASLQAFMECSSACLLSS